MSKYPDAGSCGQGRRRHRSGVLGRQRSVRVASSAQVMRRWHLLMRELNKCRQVECVAVCDRGTSRRPKGHGTDGPKGTIQRLPRMLDAGHRRVIVATGT